MIISHRLKFAFFRIPKTGSTTAEAMLRLSGAFDENDYMSPNIGLQSTIPESVVAAMEDTFRKQLSDRRFASRDPIMFENAVKNSMWSYIAHLTPSEAIEHGLITLAQLKEYKSYAYLRNPKDRYLSAYKHTIGTTYPLPDGFHSAVMSNQLAGNLLVKPSVDYFMLDGERVLEPLLFGDYSNELKRMITEVGGYVFKEIPKLNPSRSRIVDKTPFFSNEEVNNKLAQICGADQNFCVQLMKDRKGN